jgi:hypothetical protein
MIIKWDERYGIPSRKDSTAVQRNSAAMEAIGAIVMRWGRRTDRFLGGIDWKHALLAHAGILIADARTIRR